MSEEYNRDISKIRPMEFLTAYEKRECLWNPALDSYKNKNARDEAYSLMIKDFNSTLITIKDIKTRVKSIRTSYTKELRLQIKRKSEGKTYSPKLFWFNQANSFLKNVSLSRDKRNSSSLEKVKLVNEEEQLHNTTTTPPDPVAATTCIIELSMPENIDNDVNNVDIHSKTKDKQHHKQNNPAQQQLNQNETIYIQHHHPQHQLQQQHNTSELTATGHRNCITLSPSTTADNIDDDDDNTNGVGVAGGGNDDHDESCVNQILESPHLPNKIDSTSQNEVYNYCTNDTNASSNMTTTAININSSNTTAEHNRVDIGSTEYSSFNNTTAAYVDSSGLDEYDHFCRSVAAQLRCISDTYSRAFAKFKIQEILYKAETGVYRNNPQNTISQNINNNL